MNTTFAAVMLHLTLLAPPAHADAIPNLMRIVVPVCDLRSEPKDAPKDTYAHDPLQESQILFGERVRVHKMDGEWALVEALEQDEFTHKKKWEGYPGWVRVSALGEPADGRVGIVRRNWAYVYSQPVSRRPLARLPFGSHVAIAEQLSRWMKIKYTDHQPAWIRASEIHPAPPSPDPAVAPESYGGQASRLAAGIQVWKYARTFLGVPYYWGGLSPYRKDYRDAVTGVDCSGLVHLCYRAAGIKIPRDSHEQWMKSAPIKRADLRRGDLVFLANAEKPDKVVHVALYAGGEFLIEGPGTGMNVRRVTFKKKLGSRLAGIESGDTVGKKVVYFGRPNIEK